MPRSAAALSCENKRTRRLTSEMKMGSKGMNIHGHLGGPVLRKAASFVVPLWEKVDTAQWSGRK